MMSAAAALVGSALLTWSMLLVASLARSKGWTLPGMVLAVGNRDDMPEPTPFAARADRAAKNMVENLALFGAVHVAAVLAEVPADRLATPATIFFVARIAYAVAYWAGVKVLRTVLWSVSLVGIAWIALLAV